MDWRPKSKKLLPVHMYADKTLCILSNNYPRKVNNITED